MTAALMGMGMGRLRALRTRGVALATMVMRLARGLLRPLALRLLLLTLLVLALLPLTLLALALLALALLALALLALALLPLALLPSAALAGTLRLFGLELGFGLDILRVGRAVIGRRQALPRHLLDRPQQITLLIVAERCGGRRPPALPATRN